MKTGFRKIIAAGLAVVCAASMSGCADNGYIMSVEGKQIRNGIYISNAMGAYNSAMSKVQDIREEEGITTEIEDLFKENVEGKSASDWIKAETIDKIKRSVAIEKLCEKNGIALTDDEKNAISADVNSMWTEENYYAQYFYGFDTMGEYYESVGIGKDSLKETYMVSDLLNKLFLKYYDKDGITPVSDADFDAYLKENYAAVFVLELEYNDYEGLMLDPEEEAAEIQAIKDRAQSYADRINKSGASLAQIQYEFDLLQAQNDARVDAEDTYDEELSEDEKTMTREEYAQAAIDAATAEKAESDYKVTKYVSKDSSSLSTEISNYVWNAADDGKATVFETEKNSICVIVRKDITSEDEYKTDNRSSILSEMKSDDFEDVLKAEYANYTVETNDRLINGKYAPEKLKGLQD